VLASSAPPLPPEGSYVSFGPMQLMKPPEYVPCLYRGAPFEFLARRAQHEDEPEPYIGAELQRLAAAVISLRL
jgi:hypothetical protein